MECEEGATGAELCCRKGLELWFSLVFMKFPSQQIAYISSHTVLHWMAGNMGVGQVTRSVDMQNSTNRV